MATPSPKKKPPNKTTILNQIAQDTALSRKQVAAVLESLEGMDCKRTEATRCRMLQPSGPAENQGCQKTCQTGAQGHQSLYRRRNDVQGQACQQGDQGVTPEEAEGHGLTRKGACPASLPLPLTFQHIQLGLDKGAVRQVKQVGNLPDLVLPRTCPACGRRRRSSIDPAAGFFSLPACTHH